MLIGLSGSKIYNTPIVQIVLLGFVCLCGPGMFNALSGLGAGGSMSFNIALTDTSNGVLYSCLALVGLFSGSITNTLGVNKTLTIGSVGYVIYVSAFWVYDKKQVGEYVILSGAILGCLAALFWSAQGAIMMSYPEEKHKGKSVSVFWTIFNCGGIIGSLIALTMNAEKKQQVSISTSTYVVFIMIMLLGVLLSLLLAHPSQVNQTHSSIKAAQPTIDWRTEVKNTLTVWKEWRMLILIPAFLASNWFYAYQFRVNSIYFDSSTRALNGLMYWTMEVLGSVMTGCFLDYHRFSRRIRGFIGLGVLFVVVNLVWSGGFAFQTRFEADFNQPIHWDDQGFAGPFALFMMYGYADAIYQTYLYWLMGTMTNDPTSLARYAGFYKALQSIGAAIAFGIDASPIQLQWECLICWMLVFLSFPLVFMVTCQISETNDVEAFSEKELEENTGKPI
ncbi:major facilitator superfamily domain-containing protein [Choanephora cucurbitarum]|nr:major facilitator superfamily domain-containing protein [Choanephora cucurbitarum]